MLLTTAALAAGGEAHGEGHEGIPWNGIAVQAINVGILLAILIWKLKTPIKEAFQARQDEFKAEANKTAEALKKAEDSLKGIKERLTTLENSEQSSYAQAQTQAEDLKKKIESESQNQAAKMKDDVKLIASAELYKAKTEIRKEIIDAALDKTKTSLSAQAQTITQKSEAQFIKDLSQSAGQVSL